MFWLIPDIDTVGKWVGLLTGGLLTLPLVFWKVSLWLHKQRSLAVFKTEFEQIAKIADLETDMGRLSATADRIEELLTRSEAREQDTMRENARLSRAIDRIGENFDEINTRVGRLEGRNEERVVSGPYTTQPRPKPEP